jgi:hypothetical protein
MRARSSFTTAVLAGVLSGVSGVAAPSAAFAQAKDPAAAEALFRAGREAAQKGDYEVACAKFTESERLDPAVGTEFNIADCEEHRGKLATAWERFTRVVGALPPGDERVKVASARAAALEKRLPRLTITLAPGAPGGVAVRRDEVDVGPASLGTALPLDPGKHVLVVRAPGRQDATTTFDLGEGEQKTVIAQPGPEGAPAPSHAPDSGSAGGRFVAGVALGGVGVAGLVVFAVAGGLTLGKKSTVDQHCHDGLCDQTGFDAAQSGKTLGMVSGVSLVAGAVLVGAGAALVLTSGPDKKPATALVPGVGPGGASLSLIHRW